MRVDTLYEYLTIWSLHARGTIRVVLEFCNKDMSIEH
jgi:hypothetical protein